MPSQFEDVAYSPVLLPNHGAGTGCGACLELLPDAAPEEHVDRQAPVHAPAPDSASRADPTPGSDPMTASPERPTSPPPLPYSLLSSPTSPALASMFPTSPGSA